MGESGRSSWLTAVRRVFRSPTKESERGSSRKRDERTQEDDDKRRGKRRWIFKKPFCQEIVIQPFEPRTISTPANTVDADKGGARTMDTVSDSVDVEQRHAIAIAMATTAAAQAAVATAQAAVEVVRLARPSIYVRHHYAAILIQTAFRGYLARRALLALRGIVKLQALVRGRIVRRRANVTLRYMQALVRVQARLRSERATRLFDERSMDSIDLGDSHLIVKNSFQPVVQKVEEDAIKRENALVYAFSQKKIGTTTSIEEEHEENQWIRSRKQREAAGRASYDQRMPVKVVEIDTFTSRSYLAPAEMERTSDRQRICYHGVRKNKLQEYSQLTPSPVIEKPLQVHSVSPRCVRWTNSMPQMSGLGHNSIHGARTSCSDKADVVPNYMAATASAKARIRSQSAPRQRNATPVKERVGSVKKRLNFPVANHGLIT